MSVPEIAPSVRKAERCATLSSCCGVTGEAVLTDSAVILLYAGMIGAGDFLSLLAMAVLPMLNGLLILPMAGFAPRFGCRNLVLFSNLAALTGYLLTVTAAWFTGNSAIIVMLAGLLLFSGCQTGFVAGWFPLLDTFLLPERRALFLGRMRFCHQISAVIFLAALSALIGKTPGTGVLQAALFAGAVAFSGRIFFIAKIPKFPGQTERSSVSWSHGLSIAAHNRKLTFFSIYTFLLNVGMFSVVPVMLLHLKNFSRVTDALLVLFSAAAFAGMPVGYLAAHRMEVLFGRACAFRLLHWIFMADAVLLFWAGTGTSSGSITTAAALALCNACIAANSVLAGAEMMDLATPGNKTMAMAYWGMFYSGGSGLSRLGASLLTGSGLLAAKWSLANGLTFSCYQTILVCCFVFAAAALPFLPCHVTNNHSNNRRNE